MAGRGREIIDLTGQRFGKVTVVGMSDKKDAKNRVLWICKCKCGNTFERISKNLKYGRCVSCGCDAYERHRKSHITHGMSGGGKSSKMARPYSIWRTVKARCTYPSVKEWKNYGGKGVKMCDEWNNDFLSFYEWALENGYSDDLTIDRIDNSKGYSPDNCRWVDYKTQENNRTNNTLIDYHGEILTLSQVQEISGLTKRKVEKLYGDKIVQRVRRTKS